MLELGEARLIELIRTIGLFRTKAKNVIGSVAPAHRAAWRRGAGRPRDALEALPGVGRKTANVVLNVAFGEPTIAVDTHIFRVGNRTGLAPGKTPLAVEEGLERIVPDAIQAGAHHWLILHGRYVCTARNPRCETCVVNALCAYPGEEVEADRRRRQPSPSTSAIP